MLPVVRYAVVGAFLGSVAFAASGCCHAIAISLLHNEAIRFSRILPTLMAFGSLAGAIIGMTALWAEVFETQCESESCNPHASEREPHVPQLEVWAQRSTQTPFTHRVPCTAHPLLPRRFSRPIGK